jgi:hypothetical protein
LGAFAFLKNNIQCYLCEHLHNHLYPIFANMSRPLLLFIHVRTALKNISVFAALVFVIYLVANYAETAQSRILVLLHLPETSVKGVSTARAQEISDKFKSDLGTQFGILENQALNFTLGDAFTFVSRLHKIPEDFHSVQEYTSNQIENFIKKK